jgi:hypothetical protein
MENTQNADNGEAINPVENDVGIVNSEKTLADNLRGILFPDEQEEGESEPVEQSDEVQTEDNGVESESITDDTATAEDGEEVLSQQKESEQREVESSGVQKRIDKLTAMRKLAEEQAESLKQEVEQYKSKIDEFERVNSMPTKDAENPFADLSNVEQIKAEYEQARSLRYQCEASPDGFSIGETYFGPEEVKAMKVNTMKAMEIGLPKQLEFVKAREHFEPIANEAYPWYKNKDSQEYKFAQHVMSTFKDLKKFPDYKLFVGDYVRGYIARNAQSIKKTATSSRAPQMQVKPTSAPTPTNRSDATTRGLESRYLKSGSREDLKAAVSKFL